LKICNSIRVFVSTDHDACEGGIMKTCVTVTAIIAAVLVSTPASAQWLKHTTPGIPRTADGKADLTAPAPRTASGTPNLSGLWASSAGPYGLNIAADVKSGDVLPWADALYKQRELEFGKDNPTYRCMPPPAFLLSVGAVGSLFRIVQTPELIVVLAENGGLHREIFTDGRRLPNDPNPTWMGYSVGHWEGDTLVVESAGFNDKTWLDGGHPHTEALRVTERWHRKDFGHLEQQITIADPKTFARPFSISTQMEFRADTEILEEVCNENEKDLQHFVITDADRRRHDAAITLSAATLASYAGTYETEFAPPDGKKRQSMLIVEGDRLFISNQGGPKIPLEAKSETTFSVFGGTLEFFTNDKGVVTHYVVRVAEGNFKSIKK
jgi:hypothetical protein